MDKLNIKIYTLSIETIEQYEGAIASYISSHRLQKANNYVSKDARLLSLGSAFLLKAFTYPEEEYFNEYNKPLKKHKPYFNISHSKNLVAIAITNESDIGLDIESINKAFDEYIYSCFEKTEENDIKSQDIDIPQEYKLTKTQLKQLPYFSWWTKKESIAKYIGTGFIDPRKQKLSYLGNDKYEFEGKQGYIKTFIKEYNSDTYVFSICVNYKNRSIEFIDTKIEDIIN
ncbi:MAG: 4'-phosphopantetheinyl transferase superfamily protein [Clostridia bacterium]|nr:4'-phosphopantetheinyl transferase superfamily protein [Clostridia bacterium]